MKTLKDLQTHLKLGREDLKLKVLTHSPGVGPTPGVYVQSVQSGFDWDMGHLLIKPEHPLVDLRQPTELLRPFHDFYATKIKDCQLPTTEVAGLRQ